MYNVKDSLKKKSNWKILLHLNLEKNKYILFYGSEKYSELETWMWIFFFTNYAWLIHS